VDWAFSAISVMSDQVEPFVTIADVSSVYC